MKQAGIFGEVEPADIAEPGVYSVHFELPQDPQRWLISEVIQLEEGLPLDFDNFRREVGGSLGLLMQEELGLKRFIPETHLVWGSKEKEDGVEKGAGYLVRRRIIGRQLGDEAVSQLQVAAQLDDFLCGALKLYQNTVDSNGFGLIPDLLSYETPRGQWLELNSPPNLKNFLIGHYQEEEDGDRLFFTDVYPLIRGGKQYLGLLKEAIDHMGEYSGSIICPRALSLIDSLGCEKAVYAAGVSP